MQSVSHNRTQVGQRRSVFLKQLEMEESVTMCVYMRRIINSSRMHFYDLIQRSPLFFVNGILYFLGVV